MDTRTCDMAPFWNDRSVDAQSIGYRLHPLSPGSTLPSYAVRVG